MSQKQDMRYHEIFRSKQIETVSFCSKFHNAEPFAVLCCFLFSHADADDPDAADSATLTLGAAGRAQAASAVAYVACAASAAVAWAAAAAASSGEAGGAGASRDANAHGAHGEAGQAIALGVCCPYASYATHPRTHPGGASIPTGFDQGGSREGASQRGRVWRGVPLLTLRFFGNLASSDSSGFVKSQNDQNVNSFQWVLPRPKPQVVSTQVSTQVKAPERKELPLIDGQVPKEAGVEGMHPIDFKAFWEQSLFKFLSTCSVLSVLWVSRDSLMLICTSEAMVFSFFVATKL